VHFASDPSDARLADLAARRAEVIGGTIVVVGQQVEGCDGR